MSAADLLGRIIGRLEAAGVPHMITGSFASTYHGEPRSTQDVDIVIDPALAGLDAFVQALPETEYYADLDVARDAFARRSQFNVIDMATGWKVDLIIRKDRPFSVEEFRRREAADLLGVHLFVATAEDSIMSKLEWSKLGDSERQLRDVAGIVAVRGSTLDRPYIERWVAELGLAEQWARCSGARY